MVWGTVKTAQRRANIDFSLIRLKELVEDRCQGITADVWARYKYHAIKMEGLSWAAAEAAAGVEDEVEADELELDFGSNSFGSEYSHCDGAGDD